MARDRQDGGRGISFRKTRAAVPYSNPGSRYSLLGYRRAADYAVLRDGQHIGEIYHNGGRIGLWMVRLGDRCFSVGSFAEAKAAAIRLAANNGAALRGRA